VACYKMMFGTCRTGVVSILVLVRPPRQGSFGLKLGGDEISAESCAGYRSPETFCLFSNNCEDSDLMRRPVWRKRSCAWSANDHSWQRAGRSSRLRVSMFTGSAIGCAPRSMRRPAIYLVN